MHSEKREIEIVFLVRDIKACRKKSSDSFHNQEVGTSTDFLCFIQVYHLMRAILESNVSIPLNPDSKMNTKGVLVTLKTKWEITLDYIRAMLKILGQGRSKF